MTCHLDSLSPELIDCIVTDLDQPDIAALRLTNRANNDKILRTRYVDCFKRKRRLWLDTSSLEAFVQLTRSSAVMCRLENLTIAGIATPAMDPVGEEDTARHRSLLTEAFSNICTRAKVSSITSLSLTIAVPRKGDGGHPRFPYQRIDSLPYTRALVLHTLESVLGALGDSGLCVSKELNLFMGLSDCGVPCDSFLGISSILPALGPSLKMLKALRVQLWPVASAQQPESLTGDAAEEEGAPLNLLGGAATMLLKLAPGLESVDIHGIGLFRMKKGNDLMNPDEELAVTTLTSLRSCSLRGMDVSERQLLTFLKQMRPSDLTLEYVAIYGGSWRRTLDHLASAESGINSYVLDDTLESGVFVHFDIPGRPKYPYKGYPKWPSVLRRSGADARTPVGYMRRPGRGIGSGDLMRWREAITKRFSSWPERYDFLRANEPPEPPMEGEVLEEVDEARLAGDRQQCTLVWDHIGVR